MESRHWNAAGTAPPGRVEEPPYSGAPGQTRVEVAQLMLPSGQAVSVQVHRVVNVATDPHLGTPALAGILHRYDVGFELTLAVPFVYHDPAKRRFALVIPESLRHEELRLRAKLLDEIAEDPANPAPGYVRDASTVVGVQALRDYLERGDGRAAVHAAEADIARRERELGGRESKLRDRETALKVREERLVKRAEGVTLREDELAARAEEIEAAGRDVAVRERELTARLESLQETEQRLLAREKELAVQAAEPARNVLDAVVRASAGSESPGPVLFGGALPPLATAIGQAPIAPRHAVVDPAPPVGLPPFGAPAAAGAGGHAASPAAPSAREPAEPRRPLAPAAVAPLGAHAAIPSLAAAPAPVPAGAGPIPSLAHPFPAQAAAPAPHHSPAAPATASAAHPSPPVAAQAGARARSEPPPKPAAPVAAEVEAAADEDEVVEDATDLVVEATGFVRLEEVEELAEEDDVEEIDVIDEVTGVGVPPAKPAPRPSAREDLELLTRPKSAGEAGRRGGDPITVEDSLDDGKTSVALPPKQRQPEMIVPGAWWRSGSPAHVQVVDGGVRFYFRAAPQDVEAVEAGCELRCQLASVDGAPVVLLALVVGRGAAARALARTVLDTGREEERRVLDGLRRSYRALVVPVDAQGRAAASVETSSAREVNVARLVERVSRSGLEREPAAALSLRALERALAEPPPLHDPDDPFEAGEPDEPSSAGEALAAVVRLRDAATHERLEHALLVLSVPNERVDAVFRRTLAAAVRFGIALPELLERRALALGVASDRGGLVTQQLAAFGEVLRGRLRSGLEPDEARRNWEALTDAAADADVAVDLEIAELAASELGVGGASAEAAPPPDPGVLALLETPELLRRLESGPGRDVIALELCRRSAADAVEALGRATRKMSRDEVVRVVPAMLQLGESVGDVLVEGLGAREAHVRQAAALGLGVLRLRRAAVPLIHLLLSESTETWREVARALGEFGSSAVRPIVRFLKEPKGKDERLAEALAHLSRTCLGDVERLAQDDNATAAAIARRALAIRPGILERDDAVRATASLDGADEVTELSHRFFAELSGLGDFRLSSREIPVD